LQAFCEGALLGYGDERNRPDKLSTSKLSPYLRFGQLSPRQIWHTTNAAIADNSKLRKDGEKFLSEVGWREFSYHLLYHFPTLPNENLRPEFNAFPWVDNPKALHAWQKGMTGYPIVDAGMRELYATGWMHNRVRMIVASFLIKDLRVHWQHGEAWFWDTLVDADQASNAASWQWVAGCGADAAPYFRIFNPITQGEKFDPEGHYVRRWIPELAKLPQQCLHKPWEASPLILKAADVKLGATYPNPMVDHSKARDAALAAFENIKKAKVA
jgi:deoxyribodipyrimidine photo-lyase